jgi:asparagine synthase (glutamine-hydrolysing)
MPGIAGHTSDIPSADGVPILQRMLDGTAYDSDHEFGLCHGDGAGVIAGWTSQKIDPDVFAWNGTRDIALLFSGELFSGLPSRSGTPMLQSLLSLYEESGPRFLEQVNGWFCGLLLDLRNKQALLFNDRYGLGRIYIHESSQGLYFSSNARSLLGILPHCRGFDDESLAEWLSCGCVLQNRTLFQKISLLPPGSAWTFSADGKVTRRTYFDPASWKSQPSLSAAEFYEQLKETFPRVLKRYMNGDQPVGMSLTGGLDGRMIMSWSHRQPGELPCYTFNGPLRDCADVTIARKVADACGQTHQTLPLQKSFFSQFPTLAEESIRFSDGAMDVTGSAEIYLNRLARQVAPVRLTGNYGSEILRRHVAFRPRAFPSSLLAPDLAQRLPQAGQTYAEESAGHPLSFIAFKQVPWHHFARFAVERSQLRVRSPFLDNELVALAFRAPPEASASADPSLRLIAEGNPLLGRIPTDRGITYPARRGANRLHRSIAEFLAKAEYAYDYGMPGWLARLDKSLSRLRIDRLFLGRQKFCHFRSWYRGPLAEYARQILLDPLSRSRSYLNPQALEPLVSDHTVGRSNATVEIHKLLSLELVHRVLLGRQCSPTELLSLHVQPKTFSGV